MSDSPELDKYLTGRPVLTLLRLRQPYLGLLQKYHDRYLVHAEEVVQEFVPDNASVVHNIRSSLLRIGGYQVWDDVYHDDVVARRLACFALIVTSVGSVTIPTIFYYEQSFWLALRDVLEIAATAAVVEIVAFLSVSLDKPTLDPLRLNMGFLILCPIIAAWLLLSQRWAIGDNVLYDGFTVAMQVWSLVAGVHLIAQRLWS
jgi:hypothetical protein